jgi:hypothetical protein
VDQTDLNFIYHPTRAKEYRAVRGNEWPDLSTGCWGRPQRGSVMLLPVRRQKSVSAASHPNIRAHLRPSKAACETNFPIPK